MITIDNLYKSFNGQVVLNGIGLSLQKGEKISVIGPSGSGKSTLLRCLSGIDSPDSGVIRVNGTLLVSSLQAAQLGVAMVFQHFNLFPHLTALENVTLSLRYVFKKTVSEAQDIGLAQLKKVNLPYHANQYPNRLSGGEKQRVAIARALALSPQIILFDEPTSALDPENIRDVLNVIKKLKEEDITLIFVTHQMTLARHVSDRIIFVDQGKILASESTDCFFSPQSKHQTDPRIQRFLEQITLLH